MVAGIKFVVSVCGFKLVMVQGHFTKRSIEFRKSLEHVLYTTTSTILPLFICNPDKKILMFQIDGQVREFFMEREIINISNSSWVYFISLSEFMEFFLDKKSYQTKDMICEILKQQKQKDNRSLVLFTHDMYYILNVEFNYPERSICFDDLASTPYPTCCNCKCMDMQGLMHCEGCRKEFCSIDCSMEDKDHYTICFPRFKGKYSIKYFVCAVCLKKTTMYCHCRKIRYCSVECQQQDRKAHQTTCKR